MTYRGDIRVGETIDFKFTSRKFTTGAPFTLAGSPVLSAYVGNNTTPITAGITLSVDFGGVTGLNNVRVVASSGNGYATASNYEIVITTGTVDSVSVVGEVVGSFSIEARSGLMPTTAARTLDVTAGGNAGIDWANVESPTTALNLSATNIDVDQVVASVTAAVTVGTLNANVITAAATAADFTTEIQTGLATAANLATVAGYLDTEIAAILADTNELQTDWVDGGRLDLILDARASQASVNTVDDFLDTEVVAIKTVTDKLDTAVVLDGAVYQFTANALELAPTGGSAPTVGQIADAVWDEVLSGHVGAGSAGEALDAAGTAGDPWTTPLPGAYGSGTAGKIIGDNVNATITSRMATYAQPTGFLAATFPGGTVANTTNITAGTITTVTNLTNAPTSGDLTATMKASVTTAASDSTPVATVSGDLSATMKTSVTTAATAATPTVTLAANAITAAATAADFTTEIQAGLATSAALTTAQSDLDNIQTRLPAALVGGRMDSNIAAINGDADAAATSAILNGATIVYRGTVTGAATTSTLIDSGLTESDVDHWKGRIIVFTSVITRQATSILAFNPTTDQLTFDPTTQAPTGASYVII